MRHLTSNKLIVASCAAVVLCGSLAAWRLASRESAAPHGGPSASAPGLSTNGLGAERRQWIVLPKPMGQGAQASGAAKAPRASTPEEQAAAMMRVSAGSLVRALSQAAAMGNTQAVEDLVKGLPRYGEVARKVIEEELSRTKSPKSREALTRALAQLRS